MVLKTVAKVLGMLFLPLSANLWAQPMEAVLDNGMKVIVKQDSRVPVAVSQLWYRVGSVDEVNGRTGLSHLLEHMMFKGTAQVQAGRILAPDRAGGWQGQRVYQP
ncbi:M16 family metallopeptidase [Paludibacterium denitrificans]|uniref:M16 family metallopeptidase n=1 Tax=Paludibacterium denitrificans TaxID=2675226 RepID=UPI001E488851|nr:insulinase family protein [Paludibacterium denitrificans]